MKVTMKLFISSTVSLLVVSLARFLMVRFLKKVSLDVLLSIGFLALAFMCGPASIQTVPLGPSLTMCV